MESDINDKKIREGNNDKQNSDWNVVMDPGELLQWVRKHKHLKESSFITPIDGYELHDIKVAQSNREDDLFLQDDDVYFRIRRGNCIASMATNDGEIAYKMVRKGIIKFFDYQSDFSKKRKIAKRLLNPIMSAFKGGKKIRIYLTEKANGENLQIAYEPYYGGWIIGSKNVSIIVRDQSDLDWYKTQAQPKDRYNYVIEFTELWFKILNEKILSKGLYTEFLKDIEGFTLVGENIGDLRHQHIKLYMEKNIAFFGMVKTDSSDICEPIIRTKELLEGKYGLTVVGFKTSPDIDNFEEFTKYMKECYNEVLLSDVEQNGEGCVAYFSKITTEGEKVVSVAKLKTFEYRFLRTIRERIKNNKKNHSIDVDKVIKDVGKESNRILKEEGDNLDLQGYLNFGRFLLNVVNKLKSSDKHLEDVYAQFIFEVKALYNKVKGIIDNVQYEDMKDLIVLLGNAGNAGSNMSFKTKESKKIPEEKKDVIMSDEDPDESNNSKKSKKKEKKVEKAGKGKINSAEEYYSMKEEKDAQFDAEMESLGKLKKGITYILIPLGLIGSGKSTIFKIMQDIISSSYSGLINLQVVSSDEIHRKYIDEHLEKNPKKTFEQALTNTRNCSKDRFNGLIKEYIKNSDKEKINLIFLDKNFPFQSAQDMVDSYISSDVKAIAFYPRIYHNFSTNVSYPFSINYILQCYFRLKQRKGHETLDFDINPYAHYILLSFLSLYRNHQFVLERAELYPLTITDEDEYFEFSPSLAQKFDSLMKNLKNYKFDIEKIKNKLEGDIDEIFDKIEDTFKPEMFADKREVLRSELEYIFKNKIKL
jgi:hypothetical protein